MYKCQIQPEIEEAGMSGPSLRDHILQAIHAGKAEIIDDTNILSYKIEGVGRIQPSVQRQVFWVKFPDKSHYDKFVEALNPLVRQNLELQPKIQADGTVQDSFTIPSL